MHHPTPLLCAAAFATAAFGTLLTGCGTSSPLDLELEADSVPWSQITGKIAFTSAGGLFIIDGTARTLTVVKDSGSFSNLAWKYDGAEITYGRFDWRSGSWWRLHGIRPDGSGERTLYSPPAHNNYPAWSRDGRLAYWFNGEHPLCQGAECMYSVFIDDAPFFTDAICNQSRPAWSPDGNFLVISISDSTAQASLYRVALNDTTIVPLLRGSSFSDPIYSPDGTRIAFTKWGSGQGSEIWTINADGTNPVRLTSDHQDSYSAWSPDGSRIAFGRWDQSRGQIFLVNAEGGSVTQVTRNGGEYPTWIP